MNHNTKLCPDCAAARPLSEFYVTREANGYVHYTTRCKVHHRTMQAKKHDARLRRQAGLRRVLRRHGLAAR